MSRIVESLYGKYELTEGYLDDFDYLDFESSIPHNMRFKEVDVVDKGRTLYWITQEPFDEKDIEVFKNALEHFTFDNDINSAYVVLRDNSSYNYENDKQRAAGVFIEL